MLARPLWILCGLWIVSVNAQIAVDEVDSVLDLDDAVTQENEAKDQEKLHETVFQEDKEPESLGQSPKHVVTNESIVEDKTDEATDTANAADGTNDAAASPTSKDADEDVTNDDATIKEEDPPVTTSAVDEAIHADLDGLTNEELEAVCLERGFEIRKGDGTALTRADLLEAATRCLKLEEEMKNVLEDNPDLALELDAEIERMKEEKERLEADQAAMMKEKSTLEDQLREAGVDPGSIETKTSRGTSLSATSTTDTPETLEEVLRTSFTMLFDRVGNDFMLVGKVLGYVAKPVGSSVALAWRYAGPTVEGFLQQGLVLFDSMRSTAPAMVIQGIIDSQLIPARDVLWPIVQTTTLQAMSLAKVGLAKLDTIEPAHKVLVVVGAIVGPLKDSLLIGWRNTLRPNLSIVRRKGGDWFKRLRDEAKLKTEA